MNVVHKGKKEQTLWSYSQEHLIWFSLLFNLFLDSSALRGLEINANVMVHKPELPHTVRPLYHLYFFKESIYVTVKWQEHSLKMNVTQEPGLSFSLLSG